MKNSGWVLLLGRKQFHQLRIDPSSRGKLGLGLGGGGELDGGCCCQSTRCYDD